MTRTIVTFLLALLVAAPLKSQIVLNWDDLSSNEDGFEIERSVDGSPFVLLSTVPTDVETYTDAAPVGGVANTYRIRAFNSAGASAYSNESTVTPAVPPDGAPANLRITQPGRLVNLSNRGLVQVDANIAIGGFVIADGPLTVLIRGVGPSLAQFNVPGVLADPQLTLFRAPQTEIASNDDWQGDPAISAAAESVFAFPLDPASEDAALLMTLEPGQYTVHLSGVGGLTGTALLEIYAVAP